MAMYFVFCMIRLRRLDFCLIIVMYFVCNLIMPDHADHWTPVAAESIIPNHIFANLVMVLHWELSAKGRGTAVIRKMGKSP
jgi:hypothetical protein